jgi:hypothetical protein
MSYRNLEKFGFKLNRNSTHTARTIMLAELALLIDWIIDSKATKTDYLTAITEGNCLNKRSVSNRKITANHLAELYTFDLDIPTFRALIYLWTRDEKARPLMALLMAYTRDSILHDTAQKFLAIPPSDSISSQDTEIWINELEQERFSKSTLLTTARNLNSSWTQSGHLVGRVQKTRKTVEATVGATAFALFLSYLSGLRGVQLFQSEFFRILECSEQEAIGFAQEASQKGWITFRRVTDVIDVQFPHFLTEKDKDLLIEQS